MDPDAPLLSIVIPVGPGDRTYPGLLERLAGFPADCEVVLSGCETLRPPAAGKLEVRETIGSRGRAAQLNRGIAVARARYLWLVHADTRPDAAAMAAAAAFARAGAAMRLGWFGLAYIDGPRLAALNAHGANLRSRLLGLPFGDQAWLLPRPLFERVGGFDPSFGRGEDLDFVIRARAAGARLAYTGARIATSARRYGDHGWLTTTLAHVWLTLRLWRKSKRRLTTHPRNRPG